MKWPPQSRKRRQYPGRKGTFDVGLRDLGEIAGVYALIWPEVPPPTAPARLCVPSAASGPCHLDVSFRGGPSGQDSRVGRKRGGSPRREIAVGQARGRPS